MDEDTPLTVKEISLYAPIYDACVQTITDHLPKDLCSEFSRDVPYDTLADFLHAPLPANVEENFLVVTENLYPYATAVISDHPNAATELYHFIIDFWQEQHLSFYDLSNLVMKGRDAFPNHPPLEQRIESLLSLVLDSLDRRN